jgi:hypothetical protein
LTTLLVYPASLLGLAWLATASPIAELADPVQVRQEAARVELRSFDPASPPAEMPPLAEQERAVTHSEFGIGAEVRVVIRGDHAEGEEVVSVVDVEGLAVDLGLVVTVWVPEGAPATLVEHEDGHRSISELFYADAGAIARRLASRHVGRSYRGRGATVEAARRAAMNRVIRELNRSYLRATHQPASRVNELFDQLTDHGRGELGSSAAVAAALRSWREESASLARAERSPVAPPARVALGGR